jgi:hypothetical protein
MPRTCSACAGMMVLDQWWECTQCGRTVHSASCGPYAFGDDVYADCVCGLGSVASAGCECGACNGAGHDVEVTS